MDLMRRTSRCHSIIDIHLSLFFAAARTITGDYSFAAQEKTLDITSWEEVVEVK
jgi:hypothetical protein